MPDVRRQSYGTPISALTVKTPKPEIFTVHVTDIGNNVDQYNGVLVVTPTNGWLAIAIEDGSTVLLAAHRIANVVVTPGRD